MKIFNTIVFALCAFFFAGLAPAQPLSKSLAPSGGDLVCVSPNHTIQDSFDGTYIKWETGEISDGATIPGANFDPYSIGGKLAFFWPNSANGNAGVATTAAGTDWRVLHNGDQVGPTSLFSQVSGAAVNWTSGADGYLGFKFDCSTAGICYGFAHMTSTGPNGFPATLAHYCFDRQGDAVTIATPDWIFCSGFELGEDGSCGPSDVVTGTINLPLINNGDGSAFNFVTGDLHSYDSSLVDDINLYNIGSGMRVYWYADVAGIVGVGGVVDSGGTEYAVLQSGDVVGPSQTISSASLPMANWLGGANGYIGIAFENQSTGVLNYGYIHMTTSSPQGYTAQFLEYGYNNVGNPITIP